jgi:hypothetical protein
MAQGLRPHTVHTVCEHGQMCRDDHAGHALTPMRLRLATATPSGWRDAVVTGVEPDGRITVALWHGGSARLWQHADLQGALVPGDVVAVHRAYGVLAAGTVRWSVAIL